MAYNASDSELERLTCVECEGGSYGGWRSELLTEKLEDVEEKYLVCRVCGGLLRDACLFEKEIDHQEVTCSVCVPEHADFERAQLYQDSVNEKYVVCPLREKGCDWNGAISHVISHLNECDFFPVECPLGWVSGKEEGNTTVLIERRFLEEHQSSLCPMRDINCEYCDSPTKVSEMNEHISSCEEYLVPCPNSCSGEKDVRKLRRKDLPSHLGEDCPLQEVECPYAEYGCSEKMERRLVGQHEKESIHKHFNIALENLKKQYSKILMLESENAEKINEISRLKKDQREKIVLINVAGKKEITKLKKVVSFLISTLSSSPPVGTLEWRVTGVLDKIEKKEITFSEPFYVGYYRCQCETAWDHQSQGHLACFLHILKGDWDSIMKWPFRWKCTFIVYNQKDKTHNYVKSSELGEEAQLYPRYFEKPSEFGNNGFGLLVFISHEEIQKDKYLKNDSINFKIIIE